MMTSGDVIGTVKGGKTGKTYKVYRNPAKSRNGYVSYAGDKSLGVCESDHQAISKAEAFVRDY